MKAQIIRLNEELHLLFSTGAKRKVSLSEAKQFIETFDSESNYPPLDNNLFVIDSFKNINGETLALIDDNNHLIFYSAEFLRELFNITFNPEINYISAQEYADKHNKSRQIVLRLCNNNRIPGVIKKGTQYLIPETAPYPIDRRCK